MVITDRIKNLGEYFVSFQVVANEDASFILLRLPSTWTIPDQEALLKNYKVQLAVRDNGVFVMTEISNGVDCLFDAADYIVTFNKNIEERQYLLTKKIDELTHIFATESLENLKGLKIVLPDEKSGKKSKKEKEAETVVEEKLSEKPVEEQNVEKNDTEVLTEINESDDLMSLAQNLEGTINNG